MWVAVKGKIPLFIWWLQNNRKERCNMREYRGVLHIIYASPLYCIAQSFPGDILVIRTRATACASRTGVLHLGFRRWACEWSSLPEGCPQPRLQRVCTGSESSPGAENCVGSPLWAGTGGEEQVTTAHFWVCKHWTAKDKEQGFCSVKAGGLKYSSFVPVSNSMDSLGSARVQGIWGSRDFIENKSPASIAHVLVLSEILQVKNDSTKV